MKRLVILIAFVWASQACHRKEYALFDDLAARPYLHETRSNPPVIEKRVFLAEADSSGILQEEKQVVVAQPILALAKAANPQRAFIKKKQIKTSRLSKQSVKPLFKQKIDEPKPLPSRGLGVASLVLGAVGLVLLIPSLFTLELFGLAFTGFLLGITGIFFGIFSLLRQKDSPDVPSGKTAAIIGVIFSSLAMAAGAWLVMVYIFVTLFSALFSFS
ncbi:hypothetical protein [Persicitalea jodogahamensis]|uniref:hypothetical protein n=1 Tax=Persicitalea jodogahamensis TaxID=402147 RepID=UPI001671C625|nr:hypothetical protein [Persicitalea jodogahamensis]